MEKSLGDHVADTASNLLPLLGLLFGIMAVLILVVIYLRFKVRAQTGGGRRRRDVQSPVDMQPDDVANVLGKTFNVVANAPVDTSGGACVWCALKAEANPCRLLLARSMDQAVYFPGREAHPADEGFPETIEREEGAYQRMQEPAELEPGWKIATYQGPNDRFVAVEIKGDASLLWRGKSIPAEGVTMIEES